MLGRFFGGVVDQLDGLELRKKLQGEQEGGTRVEEELARGVSIVRPTFFPRTSLFFF